MKLVILPDIGEADSKATILLDANVLVHEAETMSRFEHPSHTRVKVCIVSVGHLFNK
jgi:hypothetical protein